MCCENNGASGKVNGECPDCGNPTVDGISTEICNYAAEDCATCGHAYCDESC